MEAGEVEVQRVRCAGMGLGLMEWMWMREEWVLCWCERTGASGVEL